MPRSTVPAFVALVLAGSLAFANTDATRAADTQIAQTVVTDHGAVSPDRGPELDLPAAGEWRLFGIGRFMPGANRLWLDRDRLALTFMDGTAVDLFKLQQIEDRLYLVREGTRRSGDCVSSYTPVEFSANAALGMRLGATTITCTGYKCGKCELKEGNICRCTFTTDPEGRCDQTITKGPGGIVKPGIMLP